MSAHAQTPSAAKAPIAKSAPPNFDKPDEEKRNPSASLVVDSSPYATSLARGAMKDPISPSERSSSSPCCSTSLARGAIQDPLRRASPASSSYAIFAPFLSQRERRKPLSVRPIARPVPPTRLALRSCRQGERCTSNDISRYKRKIRVYRLVCPSSRKA